MGRSNGPDDVPQESFRDRRELGKEDVRRRLTQQAGRIFACQIFRQLEHQFLLAPSGTIWVQIDVLDLARSEQRRTLRIGCERRLHLHLRRNLHGIEPQRSHLRPVDAHTVPNRLPVSFDARKPDLQSRAGWNGIHVMALLPRLGCSFGVCFEWHNLERHPEDLRDLFSHQIVVPELVSPSPQSASDHLLAQ